MKPLHFLMLDLKSYYNSPAYQLGLIVAYACTEKQVTDTISFTFSEHSRTESAHEIAEKILDVNPDLVTMSNYSWNYKKICGILDYLTKSQQKLPYILIGGPNSAGSFGIEMMKEYPIISAMVEGEGEPAFKDICLAMATKPEQDPFENAKNCLTRTAEGEIVKLNHNHRIEALDDVPSPYLEGIIPIHPAPLFYETNRGCPYRCTFCYWGSGNSKIYRLSHERITEEITFFAKNKVRALFLADANFGIFPDDANIAQLICDANAKYGYPIRSVGVNWAKNSSDRILEIASIFKKGKISVATTLAIQSVTEEAEKISKRYAMPPSRFVNLVKSADEKNIDTYTDLIWGLPGESYPEFLQGLEAVISTGVPSLMIHQLSLLSGTSLYESKEELKIKLLSEVETSSPVAQEDRSDYYDYIVVSHKDMSYEDMRLGTRIMGISHVFHNHDLGKIVNFYLARYGLGIKEVYTYFDAILMGEIDPLPVVHKKLLDGIKKHIIGFAEGTGNDETIFFRRLSEHIWFEENDNGLRSVRKEEVRLFMHDFYLAFCQHHNVCQSKEEKVWMASIIDYNWLISPKPTWSCKEDVKMELDVHTIWKDISTILYSRAVLEKDAKEHKRTSTDDNWKEQPIIIKAQLKELLSADYLSSKQYPVSYKVENPWVFPPSKTNIDWLLTAKSKHCTIIFA